MRRIKVIKVLVFLLVIILSPAAKAHEDPMAEHPELYIKITDWSVYGTWGAVAIIHHVTVENTSDIAYKDVRVRVYYTSTAASQEAIIISQETGFLPITLPPQSKGTYLKGGTTLGSGSQFMTPTRIEVLGATPVLN